MQFAPLFDEVTDTDRLSDFRGGCGGGFDSPSIESLTLNPLPADMDSFTTCYTSTSNDDMGNSPPQHQVRAACPKDRAAFIATPKRSVNMLAAESMNSTLSGNIGTPAHRKADDASRSTSQFAEGESIFSEDLIATEFVPDNDSETVPGILERRLPASKDSESDNKRTGFLSHAIGGCYSCSDLHDHQQMMQLWHASKTKAKALSKNVMQVIVVLFDRDDEAERGGHHRASTYSYDYSETPVTEVSRYTYTSSEGDEDSCEFDDNDNEEEDDGERSSTSRSNRSGFGRRDEAHSDASLSQGDASVLSNRESPPKALLGTDPLLKVNDGVKKLFGDSTDTFSRKQSQQFDRATDRFAC